MIRSSLAVLALAFALAHAPFLISTLDDIDAVNFALGIRDFDVAEHRPHPPGYPVYIALGKAGVAVARALGVPGPSSAIEARTLSTLSLIAALAAIVLLYRTFAVWSSRDDEQDDAIVPPWRAFDARALAGAALMAACPLFWYLAVRPMSDVPGLAAALAAQACLGLAWWRQQPDAGGPRTLTPDRMAASGRMIVLGALLAGLAIGFRSQNAMLTVPLLAGVLFDRIGRGVAGAMLGGGIAFGLGVLAWFVPLVVASGGWNAYLAALGSQAGEDFAGVDMLYQRPSPRLLLFALWRTFVAPWDSPYLAGLVLLLAGLGAARLLMTDRRALVMVGLAAVPYLGFHLLFHDTTFIRYALPVVPAVVYLGVCGAEFAARQAAVPLVGALALWSVAIAAPVLATYSREPSPTVRAVEAMEREAAAVHPGAVGMHQTFRRPLQAEDITLGPMLPAPPRREWLELVRYWRDGNTAPLWFLADPRRSDLALIDPESRRDRLDFTWRFASMSELGGMRPAAARWYRMRPPGWFVEEGWALTPETAGMARLMGRGPSQGPIAAWVRRRPQAARVMVGGRHLGEAGTPPVQFTLSLDGVVQEQWQAAPGFFLQEFAWPAGTLGGEGLARLTISASAEGAGPTPPTAIEQFDLQTTDILMWGYGEGWHEAEYDPALGVWRWTSDRAVLHISGGEGPVVLTLRAESPRRYFDEAPQVRILAGGQPLGETRFDHGELWTVTVPRDRLEQGGGQVVLETDRTFSPAEQNGSSDQRRLGLRIFDVTVATEH